ncbi:uncharacterized protein A4U43_C01F24250 [Asparagus officinalis]|uniref:Protein kinase domain-containing protein n=1 Tax=Asparagus officinalis TaxID=4686 RepID=A0A5P1FS10_ASPOF|nr:uncharacterized protein A4U43_C01F24250 [Asparagus officinalis]
MTFATLLSTFALFIFVIVLCVRVEPPLTVFLICSGADLVLVLRIGSSVLVKKKTIAQNGKRTSIRLVFSDEEEENPELEFNYLRRVGGSPKKFHYEELKVATNNFQTPIGRGGSGSVFKGALGDGLPVAVKRIEGELYREREFRSEIAAIVFIQHVNLVTILGYCIVPGGYRFLAYEFIQNESLC